jgi:hypothetical protein
LKSAGAIVIVPETLPSELYADGSHPLTKGYALLATRLLQDADFKSMIAK